MASTKPQRVTDDCFTVAEVAARWKCDKRVVNAAIKARLLRSFTVGARERITLAEIRRYEGEEENHGTGEERALVALDRLREIRH